jgi:NAD-dependent dihydropyrimidine dehydrogenase PreA subunit
MKREIIKIDEDKCNGCGLCIPNCHEGALQIIDGKARLISDLMCDGLGACIGHCPEGAMEIEIREASPYDEIQVMKEMVSKGKNVVIAHMKHLKDHGEFIFLRQAAGYLMENENSISFPVKEVMHEVHFYKPGEEETAAVGAAAHSGHNHEKVIVKPADIPVHQGGGCPGSRSVSFSPVEKNNGHADGHPQDDTSRLGQWPVQMHLINPRAAHFQDSDLLLAADCVAYSTGDFHNRFLKGKTLAIACPKLDSNKEVYVEKLIQLVRDARINTLTVMKMEVPCCSGIEQMAVHAVQAAGVKVPVKSITVGIKGDIQEVKWL